MNYYNEFNPESAAMLRQMMADGLIPEGFIDERSITEVSADDLRGYTQCHFFAGIGGWSFALQYAGWPENKPAWTGSCPCQPFSPAGRQKGKADDRHLWPVWQKLIAECKPAVVFGEQVKDAITHGWLDDVYEGLEAEGYAVGAAILPACSVGRPHKRERLFFVGYAEHHGLHDTAQPGSERPPIQHDPQGQDCASEFAGTGRPSDVADANLFGYEAGIHSDTTGAERQDDSCRQDQGLRQSGIIEPGDWVLCPDGRSRPVKPGIPLLVDGVPDRRPLIHGFGNAIVLQAAAAFIKASI